MKKILFAFYVLAALLFGAKNGTYKALPYDSTLSLLRSVSHDAIILGTGRQNVHVFIDPLCPHSRKFVSMVVGQQAMLSKYRFHFYLYSIPRLHSEAAVLAVYLSDDAAGILIDIMVHQAAIPPVRVGNEVAQVRQVASVAEQIGVFKRPFLFVER
ncbi:MAG TPA: hypothetical protein ENL04_02205 [Sulfuricurvum sp.]|nr:hypothetical protein [Sulfuricurvum sp.]